MIKKLFAEVSLTHALKEVLKVSLLVSVYCAWVYYFFERVHNFSYEWLSYVQSIFGILLGLLLVFRSNRAYERWWEARTLWGQLVNASRNLAIKIKVLLAPDGIEAIQFTDLINSFCDVLAIHLRKKCSQDDFKKIIQTEDYVTHMPSYLAEKLYRQLCQHPKTAEGFNLLLLDNEFVQFMNICGGCERIKNTLISLSFRVFIKHVFILFVLILPWSLIQIMGIWSIPTTILITYLLIAIEGIARNLEEPFGLTEDHLDLCSITRTIKDGVSEILVGH